jgi:hypothetical protein
VAHSPFICSIYAERSDALDRNEVHRIKVRSGTKSGTKMAPAMVCICESGTTYPADYRIGLERPLSRRVQLNALISTERLGLSHAQFLDLCRSFRYLYFRNRDEPSSKGSRLCCAHEFGPGRPRSYLVAPTLQVGSVTLLSRFLKRHDRITGGSIGHKAPHVRPRIALLVKRLGLPAAVRMLMAFKPL